MKINPYTTPQSIQSNPLLKQGAPKVGLAQPNILAQKPDLLTFSGRKMREDRDRQAVLRAEIEEHQREIDAVNSERMRVTATGVATGGTMTAMFMGMDLGLNTVLATAAGNLAGRATAFFHHGSRSEHRESQEAAQTSHDTIQTHLSEAETHLRNIGDIARHAETALSTEPFYDCDFKSLAHGLYTPYYDDVENRANEVKPKAIKVPGFKDRFFNVTGKNLADNPVPLLKNDLDTGSEALQDLALQRLAQVDTKQKESPRILRDYLNNRNPRLAARALRVMAEHLELREGENKRAFISGMERFLKSGQPEKMNAALDAIMETDYPSANINHQLRVESESWPLALRHRAVTALQHRVAQGTDRPFNSQHSTRKIMSGMVGNDHLTREMQRITRSYVGSINDKSNQGPALALYLPGLPGIGKTRLVSRIQQEFHNDPHGMQVIKMGELKSKDQLVKLLKDASPLQGKTLFFDEFQAFDSSRIPQHEKEAIIEFMKMLFPGEESPNEDGTPEIKEKYGIDPKNVILAVGTNVDLSQMQTMNTPIGRPLRDRIISLCREVNLEDDLRPYIPDFVNGFAENRFFEGATASRTFENLKEITPHAKETLIDILTRKARSSNEVSGRFLANKTVTEINDAVQDQLERGTQFTTKKGIVTQPLKIDVDRSGELFAV
jgi:hypothetical protein